MAAYDDALFRAQFPEFADTTKYPVLMIDAYWDMATMFISAADCPFNTLSGKRLATALNMLTAHLIVLGIAAKGKAGKTPGSKQGGFTTSATIGEVSVTKLAPPAATAWEWWLSQTPYGSMLWALLDMLSVGGFSVGGLPERDAFRKVGGIFL
jgi:hypothetical protein